MSEESKTVRMVEYRQRIERAAIMNCDDILIMNLSKLLQHRKEIAQNLLNSHVESVTKELEKVYEYTDRHIESLLSLREWKCT